MHQALARPFVLGACGQKDRRLTLARRASQLKHRSVGRTGDHSGAMRSTVGKYVR
jgi:hypothetical protein